MKKAVRFVEKLATLENLILFTGLNILFSYLVNRSQWGADAIKNMSGGLVILDLQMFYTPSHAYAFLDQLGVVGRAAYLRMLGLDFLFIIGYVLFNSIFIFLAFKLICNKTNVMHSLCLLPVFTGILDIIENFVIIAMLQRFPEQIYTAARVAGCLTTIKTILAIIGMVIMAIAIPAALLVSKRISLKNRYSSM